MSEKIDLIGIPLDGSTDEKMREFRTDSTQTVKKTASIIKLLDENNFRISINTVVHKGNYNDLSNIYTIISKYTNVIRWELHQFSTAISTREDIKISNKLFKEAVRGIDNYKNVQISPKYAVEKSSTILDYKGDIIKSGMKDRIILANICKDRPEEYIKYL